MLGNSLNHALIAMSNRGYRGTSARVQDPARSEGPRHLVLVYSLPTIVQVEVRPLSFNNSLRLLAMKIPVEQTCRWFFFDSDWGHDVVGMVVSEVAAIGGQPLYNQAFGAARLGTPRCRTTCKDPPRQRHDAMSGAKGALGRLWGAVCIVIPFSGYAVCVCVCVCFQLF